MTTQEEGDEAMSGFQKSLLRRLNTMQKPQTEVDRREPSAPRNKVSSQRNFTSGESSTGNSVRSFVEELQMKPNAVTQKRNMGGRSQPERNIGRHGQPERNTGRHGQPEPNAGGHGQPERNAGGHGQPEGQPEHGSTASRNSRGDMVPGKKGGAKVGPPPPAPKRNTGAPQTLPRPTAGSDDRNEGAVISDAANESVNGSSTRNRAAGIASKLELALAGTQMERNEAKPKKPGKLVHVGNVAEKLVHGSVIEKPASVGVAASGRVVQASEKEPQDGVAVSRSAEEPIYVNISQVRKEMPTACGTREEASQPEISQSNQGDTESPPPAPRRTKSVRNTTKIAVDGAVSAGVHCRSTGIHSGSNSGASGDGVVVHHRKTKASKASNQNVSGDRAIAPMGSSSESENSGDGKVQRMRQKERVKRVATTTGPLISNQPPPPQHPPPADQPLPPPRHLPPADRPPPLPQHPPPQHPPPQIQPPQLPPPRQHQQPTEYERTERPPSHHGSHQDISTSSKPAYSKSTLKRRPSYTASALLSSVATPPPSASASKLLDFLCSHAHLLPTRVVVREGNSGDQFVSTSKTLNLHFLRNVRVATVCDPVTQIGYSIPCNSSVKLGLIYNPSDESVSPYTQLKTVADVMKLKRLPTIVTATTSYDGGSPEKSVVDGEILFVKGTAKGGTLTKGKQLHMVNALGEEKHLPSKCSGSFSTDPRHTKVYLSALLQQGIQWPQFVVFYPSSGEVLQNLPASMSNSLVELKGVSAETSVIATPGENRRGGSTVLDINTNADLEVAPLDTREPDKQALAKATTELYQSFRASESRFVVESQPSKSSDLQCLFYRKILDEDAEGVHLYLPSKDGPPPAMFNLKGKGMGKDSDATAVAPAPPSVSSDDNVSISLSIASTYDQEELTKEQGGWLNISKPADTMSISSSVSGNVTGGAISHSASGIDLCDSNAEDDDEEQAIYEDIDDICENLRKEVETATAGEASEEQAKEAGKKSSILSFLKKKTKVKKGKDKQSSSSDAYVDVEFEGDKSSAPSQQAGEGSVKEPVPDIIPTHSHSSSESYDEMRPGPGYISDNYEECEFGDAPTNNAGVNSVQPMVPNAPELVTKKKASQKSLKAKFPEPGTPLLVSMDDLSLFKEKKVKMKEKLSVKKGGTLPRKMKLGTGDKKAPPISVISEFPADATIADISLSEQVWSLTNQVERLKAQMKDLSSAVEALTAAQSQDGSNDQSSAVPGSKQMNVDSNLKALREMTLEQVLKLLDSIEMPQYKQSFSTQQVTGLVLTMVDEEMLRDDLNVTSKLHRVRLLKVASGEVPILGGKDSKYVKFSR